MDLTIKQFVATLLLVLAPGLDRVAIPQTSESEALVLRVDTPVVEIGRRSTGRNFMRLPSLDYKFDLMTNCPVGLEAKSISLNVADTRKSLSTDEISGDETTSVNVRIPASQIGPIAVDGFCVVQGEQETIKIPAVLSVQASLLCADEETRQMIYASRSLDVTLSCKIVEKESSPD